MKKQLSNYYREIYRFLPCSGNSKKRILSRLKETINCYLEEHPEADFAQLEAHFGTPRQIADSYISELSVTEISQKIRIRKWILMIIGILCAAVLTVWLIAVGIAAVSEWKSANGFFTESEVITKTK